MMHAFSSNRPAQSLRDCPQLELPSQAGLCHQNTNNQAFSTDLISTNWSIASNAQLSSRPLDFVMMHLMHKGGITTIASLLQGHVYVSNLFEQE